VRHASKIEADLIVADQHPGRHTAAGLLHLTDWELLRLSPVRISDKLSEFDARDRMSTGCLCPRVPASTGLLDESSAR